MTIKVLASRVTSNAAVARLLGVSEGAVRYHLGRMTASAVDEQTSAMTRGRCAFG